VQTDQIVQSIQSLLGAMRSSQIHGEEFKQTIQSIIRIVDLVIQSSKGTLSHVGGNIGERGDSILSDLGTSQGNLGGLGDAMVNDPQNKSIKQKLAACSYEIAKVTLVFIHSNQQFVKELISLLE